MHCKGFFHINLKLYIWEIPVQRQSMLCFSVWPFAITRMCKYNLAQVKFNQSPQAQRNLHLPEKTQRVFPCKWHKGAVRVSKTNLLEYLNSSCNGKFSSIGEVAAGWNPSEAGRQLSGLWASSSYSPSSACRGWLQCQAGRLPKKRAPGRQGRAGGQGQRCSSLVVAPEKTGDVVLSQAPHTAIDHRGTTCPAVGAWRGHVPGSQNAGPGENSSTVF